MAVENISTAASIGTTTVTLDVPVLTGTGTGRVVVAFHQGHNTTVVAPTVYTFNGVQGTVAAQQLLGTGRISTIYYWLDADLPADAGTYTFAVGGVYVNSSTIQLFSASNVGQALLDSLGQTQNGVTACNFSLASEAGGVGLVCVIINQATVSGFTTDAGQVDIESPRVTGSSAVASSYDLTDGAMGYGFLSANYSACAATFGAGAPATTTVTEINNGDPIESAQNGVPVVGTMLNNVTDIFLHDSAGSSVSVFSGWSGTDTNKTFNAPNFLSAGLKFGAITVEFIHT